MARPEIIDAVEQLILIVTTSDDSQMLRDLGRTLVEQRAAACAQLSGPMESTYAWQGSLEQSSEWMLTIKTFDRFQYAVVDKIQRLHNYEIPEILVLEPSWVADDYLRWAAQQVRLPGVGPALNLVVPPNGAGGLRHVDQSEEHAAERIEVSPQRWHLYLHGTMHPPSLAAAKYGDRAWPTLKIDPGDLCDPMPYEFDAFCGQLAAALGVYCEPDGAFGWHPQFGDESGVASRTSVTGTIHCVDRRVLAVEMFAELRPEDWHRFVRQFKDVPWLVVQLVEAGVFVSPATMRDILAQATPH